MKDERLNKLAKVLVNYSAEVKKGDFVFVLCDEVAIPWAKEVVKEATLAGGHVEVVINSCEISEIKLKHSSEEQLKSENFLMKNMIQKADVFLTAQGTTNTRINSNIPSDKIRFSLEGAKSWRKFYAERMGNGKLRWCGTMFPTHANAQEGSMSLEEYEEFVYDAGLINKNDPISEWKKVSARQERWCEYLNKKNELHIISKDTDIKVNVSGRKWINCDGKVNFPDGEIFTSPVENDINGHIAFSFPGIYVGKAIEGIKLEVKNGEVIKATAEKGENILHELLKVDDGARFFGEVAIGTNYNIKKFTRNMLFDEKIGGTVHMAIGDSLPVSGGKNRSVLHWDMLCDMRKEGKIFADGELFYENGLFLENIL